LLSLLLGLLPWYMYLPLAAQALPNPLTLEAFTSAVWPVLVGGVIAILIGRRAVRLSGIGGAVDRTRRMALGLADVFMRVDGVLRQWPAAVLALLVVAAVLGIAMLIGR